MRNDSLCGQRARLIDQAVGLLVIELGAFLMLMLVQSIRPALIATAYYVPTNPKKEKWLQAFRV